MRLLKSAFIKNTVEEVPMPRVVRIVTLVLISITTLSGCLVEKKAIYSFIVNEEVLLSSSSSEDVSWTGRLFFFSLSTSLEISETSSLEQSEKLG